MPERLFVCGTLRRAVGHEMFRVLAAGRFLGDGTIAGRLYELGGYPGAVLSNDPADRVLGELYGLDDPTALPTLDAYEEYRPDDPTCEYVRTTVEVTLADGRRLEAWAYVYNRPTDGLPRILGGDYVTYLSCR